MIKANDLFTWKLNIPIRDHPPPPGPSFSLGFKGLNKILINHKKILIAALFAKFKSDFY